MVDVIKSREPADLLYLSTSKALPVEALIVIVVNKVLPKSIKEHIRIRSDENTRVQKDNRSGDDVLERRVTRWDPP